MGDINFKPDNLRFYIVINNKTYCGTPPVLCEKLMEEWEKKSKKRNSKRK